MKIQRGIFEIELTDEELYKAYCKKEREFHKQDVKGELRGFYECHDISKEDKQMINHSLENMVDLYEKMRTKIDTSWGIACHMAIYAGIPTEINENVKEKLKGYFR